MGVPPGPAAAAGAHLVTATDGNHGRAVARMASHFGVAATVFVPDVMLPETAALIAGEGAEVVRLEVGYDDAVRAAAEFAGQSDGRALVQDTAWEGYTEVPGMDRRRLPHDAGGDRRAARCRARPRGRAGRSRVAARGGRPASPPPGRLAPDRAVRGAGHRGLRAGQPAGRPPGDRVDRRHRDGRPELRDGLRHRMAGARRRAWMPPSRSPTRTLSGPSPTSATSASRPAPAAPPPWPVSVRRLPTSTCPATPWSSCSAPRGTVHERPGRTGPPLAARPPPHPRDRLRGAPDRPVRRTRCSPSSASTW